MNLGDNINPKFKKWLAEQSPEVHAAIETKWSELGGFPLYANQYALLKWCADNYGYDFT